MLSHIHLPRVIKTFCKYFYTLFQFSKIIGLFIVVILNIIIIIIYFFLIFTSFHLEKCLLNTFRVTDEYASLKRVILLYVFLKHYMKSQIIMFKNVM